MSRVDYAAEAATHIEEALLANQNGKWETARLELKLAEVKATLALAAEGRIANLIALTSNPDMIDPLSGTWQDGVWETARQAIVEGLALR